MNELVAVIANKQTKHTQKNFTPLLFPVPKALRERDSIPKFDTELNKYKKKNNDCLHGY